MRVTINGKLHKATIYMFISASNYNSMRIAEDAALLYNQRVAALSITLQRYADAADTACFVNNVGIFKFGFEQVLREGELSVTPSQFSSRDILFRYASRNPQLTIR